MKSSILIIIFDFFVCSLLLTVSFGSGPGSGRGMAPRGAGAPSVSAPASEFSEASVNEQFNDALAEYELLEEEQRAQGTPPGISAEEAKKLQDELDDAIGKSEALKSDLAQAAEEKKKAEDAAAVAAMAAEEAKQNATALAEEKRKAEEAAVVASKAAEEAKQANEDLAKRLAEADTAAKQAQMERDAVKKENDELKKIAQSPTLPATGGPTNGGGGGPASGAPSSPGGLDALLASRVEVKVGVTEYDSFVRGGDDLFDRTFYPVAFELKEHVYILTRAEDFSLGWGGWSERAPEDIRRFSFTLSKRGENPDSVNYKLNLLPLSTHPKLVLAPLPGSALALSPLKPVDQEALGRGLIFDGVIYKTSNEGNPMTVKFQRDNSNDRQVRLVSDAVTPNGAKEAPKPELGDYLVTPELRLVAIMLDESHGLIVSESLLDATFAKLPLSDPAKFIEGEQRWLESLKK